MRASLWLLACCACTPGDATVGVEEDAAGEHNPTAAQALSMPACGTVLGTFDGTAAYSNAWLTGTGSSCAGSGLYGLQYQCVELVMRHFKTHWGLRWYAHAKDILWKAPTADVATYSNGDSAHPPVPGDMLVWTGGTYGHVALITAVRPGAVDVLEQNVSGNGHATFTYDGATVGSRWSWSRPAGWAHARTNLGVADAGADTATPDAGPPCGSSGPADPACAAPTTAWTCSQSTYAGAQYWTCSGGKLYRCIDGTPVALACLDGCVVRAVGTDDTCR